MKLLPPFCLLLTFCSSHWKGPSINLCATDILYLSLWSSFHSSVWYCHNVPVIMKLHPQPCVLLTFCICHYEVPSTAHISNDILHLSICRSFHSSLCYSHSVPVIMKLLPKICVLLSLFTCHYVALSLNTCGSDILLLSLWSSFHISVILTFCTCLYEAFSTALFATVILYLSL